MLPIQHTRAYGADTNCALCGCVCAEWLVFEGISVDESGKQHYLDATVAYKRAVLNCIHYLTKFGYTAEQVRWHMALLRACCFQTALE